MAARTHSSHCDSRLRTGGRDWPLGSSNLDFVYRIHCAFLRREGLWFYSNFPKKKGDCVFKPSYTRWTFLVFMADNGRLCAGSGPDDLLDYLKGRAGSSRFVHDLRTERVWVFSNSGALELSALLLKVNILRKPSFNCTVSGNLCTFKIRSSDPLHIMKQVLRRPPHPETGPQTPSTYPETGPQTPSTSPQTGPLTPPTSPQTGPQTPSTS
ncbi:hypothetical protein E5288_WYG007727 [Bos mutus]|uniref:Uncharacterized protein n=1 Tax=Bos mutus TaxID=72004 RepID=A0A6B0RG29_9CETA|nr:hypothetical protein [Bos mutus]